MVSHIGKVGVPTERNTLASPPTRRETVVLKKEGPARGLQQKGRK